MDCKAICLFVSIISNLSRYFSTISLSSLVKSKDNISINVIIEIAQLLIF